ncbi:MAG: galactokinase [Spirochaetales bacterium]|nr:galactokinase [Spirochaetales bacterium]
MKIYPRAFLTYYDRMKTRDQHLSAIARNIYKKEFQELYRQNSTPGMRYSSLLKKLPDNEPAWLISAPGRTELGGNHTDHNNGKILAASVQLDSAGAFQKRDDKVVYMVSEGYPVPFSVSLTSLEPVKNEEGTTNALIRGVAAYFVKNGYRIGGMTGFLHSSVLSGSGLSSSASIEILIAAAFSFMYNENSVSQLEMALAGQFAENHYFGKPCGLMDQLACSTGGIICVDFAQPDKPCITRIGREGFGNYALNVVDTGGSHADLTPEYAAIPHEMKETAALLGAKVCRDIDIELLYSSAGSIRQKLGDRHLLRSVHFLEENDRVEKMAQLLIEGNMDAYLSCVTSSGISSAMFLQNSYPGSHPEEQGIPLAMMFTRKFLENSRGACRVHGGGFAGTIQAYVARSQLEEYVKYMEGIFGRGSVTTLQIRQQGAYCVGAGTDAGL